MGPPSTFVNGPARRKNPLNSRKLGRVEFVAHPLTRIEPQTVDRWLINRDDQITGHRVTSLVAALVVLAFVPKDRASLADALVAEASLMDAQIVTDSQVDMAIDWLLEHEYLTETGDPDSLGARSWIESWAENGWEAAARYHARTYGYPFEFYGTDGSSAEDARRMVAYNAVSPDVDRAKKRLQDAEITRLLPSPSETLSESSFAKLDSLPPTDISEDSLLNLLALLTRPIRTAGMPYAQAARLLRKTSPSGGSRHPTEFYVVSSGVSGLPDRTYQIASVDGGLDSLDAVTIQPSDWLQLLGLPDPGQPWAVVLYSSFFERNRYRYREPRTFRTVHMDVGHLMGTCELLARASGWEAVQVQHIDGRAVAAALNVNSYVECPMAATFLLPKGTR